MKLSRIVVIALGSLLIAAVAAADRYIQVPGAPGPAVAGGWAFSIYEQPEGGGEPAAYVLLPFGAVFTGYVVLIQSNTLADSLNDNNWSDVIVIKNGAGGALPVAPPGAPTTATQAILISGNSEGAGVKDQDLAAAGAGVTVAAVKAGPVKYILEPDQILPAPNIAGFDATNTNTGQTANWRYYSNVPNLTLIGMLALAGLLGIGGIVYLRRARPVARPVA